MGRHPVRLLVDDDLSRSRLTVFFRLLLAIPHIVWLLLWGIAVFFAVIANWFATLFSGRPPAGLHSFISRYVRYATHVYAFLNLTADPFPAFGGRAGTYPVDLEIDPPERQSRWVTFFRFPLVIPAAILASALFGGISVPINSRRGKTAQTGGGIGLAGAASFLGWFASLARARMPRGLRDATAWGLGYYAQVAAYFTLLTDRYPNSDPIELVDRGDTPAHPIVLEVDDDCRRSRLTVFFRALLWLPHLVWLELWGIAVQLAVFANWFIALFGGTPSAEINRFVGAYLRYETHIWSYLLLAADPFPGFTGKPGSYPIDLQVPPAERQNRWITGFRLILAIPSFLLGIAYGGIMVLASIGAWFAAMFTGRIPRGLRNSILAGVKYWAQARGYLYLITDRYPYSGPTGFGGVQPAAPPPPPAAWDVAPERPVGV